MSARFGASRIEAFLKALGETGNQTLAAKRAKVSRSWVQLHRSGDAGFRRAMDEAVASFTLGTGGSAKPPSGWGFLEGEELVVRGIGGRPGLRAREPDIEEVRASILRKIEAIERHDARRLARDREEWARRRR